MKMPHYDRVVFGNAPLRLVVGQVRFPLLFRFNEKPFLASFRETIQPTYARIAQEQQVAVKFSARGAEPSGETLWRFSDRDGSWSVVLGEGALTLESRRYTSIDEFAARFERLLSAAIAELGVRERTRFGLRFVNELRAPGAATLTDWAQLLNPKFVGYGGAPELLNGTVDRAFHEIQSRRQDGTLVIRHGLLAGSTLEQGSAEPDVAMGPFYLIDLDYFDTSELTLEPKETLAQMRSFNESIYQFFRWTLDKGRIYEQLEPR